jgi:allantoin racemase
MKKLLVINPNTTASMTALLQAHLKDLFRKRRVEAVYSTGKFGCAYISTEACYAVAAHAALECFNEHGKGCDGVLLACFGDPGLFALREVSPVPVVGLAEACMHASAAHEKRFSIVTGGERWRPMLERFASQIGLRESVVSVRTVSLTGGQIAEDPAAAIDLLAAECLAAARDDGAEEVILGGAGLAGLAERIQPRCPVPVLDSVRVGAKVALQRMA